MIEEYFKAVKSDDEDENPKLSDRVRKFLIKNRFKIALLVLALIFAGFAFYYLTIYSNQQQKQINNVDLQTKCNADAQKFLNGIVKESNSINYTYKNHYIKSFKRCYILVHGIGIGDIGLSDKLIDVFENKVVADCETFSTAPETNFCSYNENTGDKTTVTYNIDQFNEFVKPYMERN
jgi:hypothetical protein